MCARVRVCDHLCAPPLKSFQRKGGKGEGKETSARVCLSEESKQVGVKPLLSAHVSTHANAFVTLHRLTDVRCYGVKSHAVHVTDANHLNFQQYNLNLRLDKFEEDKRAAAVGDVNNPHGLFFPQAAAAVGENVTL